MWANVTHLGGSYRDASCGRIVKEIVTAGEALEELGIAPRGDDLDRRLDGVESQFKPNLIISFAIKRRRRRESVSK